MNPYLPPTVEPEPALARSDFRSIGHGARGVALFAGVAQIFSGWITSTIGRSPSHFNWGWILISSGSIAILGQLMAPWTFRKRLRGEPLARSGEAAGAGIVSRVTGSGWVHGTLFLTDTELVFVPGAKSRFEEAARFPLSEVVVRLRRAGYFLRPKIIFESGGREVTFVMGSSRAWQKAIWQAAESADSKNFA